MKIKRRVLFNTVEILFPSKERKEVILTINNRVLHVFNPDSPFEVQGIWYNGKKDIFYGRSLVVVQAQADLSKVEHYDQVGLIHEN